MHQCAFAHLPTAAPLPASPAAAAATHKQPHSRRPSSTAACTEHSRSVLRAHTKQHHRSQPLAHHRVLLQPPAAQGGASPAEPGSPLSQQIDGGGLQGQQQGDEQQQEDSHAGHAVLHDFCMMIPFGALAVMASIALWASGAASLRLLSFPLASVGINAITASVLSLKMWKQGQRSTPVTLFTAACTGGYAYYGWLHTQSALASSVGGALIPWLSAAVTFLSGLLSLFCVYNVLAGGNPPRKGSH